MPRLLEWIKKETLHVLPAVIYFFAAFLLFDMTFGVMMEKGGFHRVPFHILVISALIIGKVMMVVDNLPIINAFPGKPLIYNTVWKTFVYSFFWYVARVTEEAIPFISKYKSPEIILQHMVGEIWWPRFWSMQIWALVLFFFFVVWQEMVRAIGQQRLREMFFGRK